MQEAASCKACMTTGFCLRMVSNTHARPQRHAGFACALLRRASKAMHAIGPMHKQPQTACRHATCAPTPGSPGGWRQCQRRGTIPAHGKRASCQLVVVQAHERQQSRGSRETNAHICASGCDITPHPQHRNTKHCAARTPGNAAAAGAAAGREKEWGWDMQAGMPTAETWGWQAGRSMARAWWGRQTGR